MKNVGICDADEELAKKEPPIASGDLLLEIAPLMEEYFIGEIKLDKESIVYEMPNGQKFRITAKQV